MRFAAEMLRHTALEFSWNVPAFGEEAGIWRSHDKKQAKSAHSKSAVGRFTALDLWGNGTSTLIAKGTDVQDPELVTGLQPKTVAVDCLRLSKPRVTPEGWSKDATTMSVHQAQTIQISEGKDLRLRKHDGHTQYSSPFIAKVESATANLEDEHRQAYWGAISEPRNAVVRQEIVEFIPPQDMPAQARDALTKTVPNKDVMTTTGAQYERWKQATAKELQAFLKTASREATTEMRSRYFAAKKNIVMQLLVFSLKPMTAERKHKAS